MTVIGAAGLSSKEKSGRHDRGRNFDPIVTKISPHVALIKLKIKLKNELCEVYKKGRTFLEIFLSSLEAYFFLCHVESNKKCDFVDIF